MPSTGTSRSSSSLRSDGASASYTDAGPPESTIPLGFRSRSRSSGTSCASSSEKTPHSRMRRAISCEYCPPKSRTRTSSVATGRSSTTAADEVVARLLIQLAHRRGNLGLAVRAHAHMLLALKLLALTLKRGGDHHLCAVERRNVLVAARRHRGPERAEQVEAAVVLVRRAEEDLLKTAVLKRRHSRSPRQRGMERCHAPMEAAAGRLVCASERRGDHHGVGAARE